jgi:hypothetical protein
LYPTKRPFVNLWVQPGASASALAPFRGQADKFLGGDQRWINSASVLLHIRQRRYLL